MSENSTIVKPGHYHADDDYQRYGPYKIARRRISFNYFCHIPSILRKSKISAYQLASMVPHASDAAFTGGRAFSIKVLDKSHDQFVLKTFTLRDLSDGLTRSSKICYCFHPMYQTLTEKNIVAACKALSKTDPDLKFIYDTYGAPPLWARPSGFSTLVHIILEQQVSLASAKACHDKLCLRLGKLTPKSFLTLDDAELKIVGFSRQKTIYARNLAETILRRKLSLNKLETLPDDEVRATLKELKGIGDWTSDVYLLMVLLRPDIMPRGDLALHAAYQRLKGLDRRPGADEFIAIAERWKPYRAVAARLLWHLYLSEKKK